MRSLVSLLFVSVVWLQAAACKRPSFWSVERTSPETLRRTIQGEVVGGEGRFGSHVWLGLPFAKPPVGERRWRKPEAPEAWTGVRAATRFGHVCVQPGSPLGGGRAGEVVGDEDCLTLSVWAPKFTPEAVPSGAGRLPVMVWIHGGGNSIGTAAFYDGGRLAAEQRVVVVAVQYRLGPFGWFRHPALRAGADDVDQSGNFGTLDLLRALEWVRDNAEAFGGDPGNVTIFGESAGGHDVYSLLVSPLAQGLFHRAIVQSGGLWSSPAEAGEGVFGEAPAAHRHSSDEVLARVLVKAGQAADVAAARAWLGARPAGDVAAWMRGLSVEALLGAYPVGPAGMLDAPLVFGDGVVLPRGDWLERLAAPDGWNRVPVLAGTNRDEMRMFLFLDPRRVKRVLGLFPRLEDEASYLGASDILSRSWRLSGVDQPLGAMAASGAPELYAYRFDWHDEPRVGGADLSVLLGAAHGLEVPFVFGHFEMGPLNIIFTEANRAEREGLSEAMRAYWAEFARSGRPGRGASGTLPEWTAWSGGQGEHLVFDTAGNGGLTMTSGVETRAGLLQSLFNEPRLDARERCRVLHQLVTWGHQPGRTDYEARVECREFPFDAFPWDDGTARVTK